MKEPLIINGYPISGRMPMFTRENRQKNRDGIKTNTRRRRGLDWMGDPNEWEIVRPLQKQEPLLDGGMMDFPGAGENSWIALKDKRGIQNMGFVITSCPYGIPGQYRVMTEPLIRFSDSHGDWTLYQDDANLEDCPPVIDKRTNLPMEWRWKRDTLSSLYMPMEAARTVCLIEDVRAERLGDISGADAIKEGWSKEYDIFPATNTESKAIRWFKFLWEFIYGLGAWERDKDKWVWVIGYKVLRPARGA
jgi:hypothetical protein